MWIYIDTTLIIVTLLMGLLAGMVNIWVGKRHISSFCSLVFIDYPYPPVSNSHAYEMTCGSAAIDLNVPIEANATPEPLCSSGEGCLTLPSVSFREFQKIPIGGTGYLRVSLSAPQNLLSSLLSNTSSSQYL